MAKSFHDPIWFVEEITCSIKHFRGGEYTPGEPLPPESIDICIPMVAIPELVRYLSDHGYIKPTLTAEGRSDDVKIINRLIDVLEAKQRG